MFSYFNKVTLVSFFGKFPMTILLASEVIVHATSCALWAPCFEHVELIKEVDTWASPTCPLWAWFRIDWV